MKRNMEEVSSFRPGGGHHRPHREFHCDGGKWQIVDFIAGQRSVALRGLLASY
jgi:hypothetical protein